MHISYFIFNQSSQRNLDIVALHQLSFLELEFVSLDAVKQWSSDMQFLLHVLRSHLPFIMAPKHKKVKKARHCTDCKVRRSEFVRLAAVRVRADPNISRTQPVNQSSWEFILKPMLSKCAQKSSDFLPMAQANGFHFRGSLSVISSLESFTLTVIFIIIHSKFLSRI